MSSSKPKVLVLAGGDSPERDVSLDTAAGIFDALVANGYAPLACDPARPHIAPTENRDDVFGRAGIEATPPAILADVTATRRQFVDQLSTIAGQIDIAFNGLHGGAGEDGTVQSVLDYVGIHYTGSGAAACQLAMDKYRSKLVAAKAGVPVARDLHVTAGALASGTLEQSVREILGPHVVVKPNNGGSSVGMTIVNDFADVDAAAREAFRYDSRVLIEQFVHGKEVTMAVLDGVTDIPALEIRPKSGWYDYKNKYQKGSTDYLVPAPISDRAAEAVASYARATFEALGMAVYGRVDFRLDENDVPFLLEANTLPGMTATSLVPKSLNALGIDYNELVDRILRASLTKATQ